MNSREIQSILDDKRREYDQVLLMANHGYSGMSNWHDKEWAIMRGNALAQEIAKLCTELQAEKDSEETERQTILQAKKLELELIAQKDAIALEERERMAAIPFSDLEVGDIDDQTEPHKSSTLFAGIGVEL